MKKGQVTLEFMIIATFMLLMFATLFLALQSRIVVMRDVQSFRMIEQAGNVVTNEVRLAVQVGDGYSRQFYLPETLQGLEYNISVDQGWDLRITNEELEYVAFLERPVDGTIEKGSNTISCCNYSSGELTVMVTQP